MGWHGRVVLVWEAAVLPPPPPGRTCPRGAPPAALTSDRSFRTFCHAAFGLIRGFDEAVGEAPQRTGRRAEHQPQHWPGCTCDTALISDHGPGSGLGPRSDGPPKGRRKTMRKTVQDAETHQIHTDCRIGRYAPPDWHARNGKISEVKRKDGGRERYYVTQKIGSLSPAWLVR